METREILKNLREKNDLTQEQLAERIQVTRQAISRWETGETQPNTDTLMVRLFINPRNLCWIIWLKICRIPITQMKKPDGFSLIRTFHS